MYYIYMAWKLNVTYNFYTASSSDEELAGIVLNQGSRFFTDLEITRKKSLVKSGSIYIKNKPKLLNSVY